MIILVEPWEKKTPFLVKKGLQLWPLHWLILAVKRPRTKGICECYNKLDIKSI